MDNDYETVYDLVFKDNIEKALDHAQETANQHPAKESTAGSIDLHQEMIRAGREIINQNDGFKHTFDALREVGIDTELVYREINKKMRSVVLKHIRQTKHDFVYVSMDDDDWVSYELTPTTPAKQNNLALIEHIYVALQDKGIDCSINKHYLSVTANRNEQEAEVVINEDKVTFNIEDFGYDFLPIKDKKTAEWLDTIINAVKPFLND